MAGSHVHALFRHGDSALHGLPPHVKIVAAFAFVFAVVATPREAFWAFAAFAAILLTLAAVARLGARFVASRMLIEVPFVIVAVALPFLASGDRIDVAGVPLSVEGLWDAWNILAKATLGLLTSIVLAGTTQVVDMLRGFETLRVPGVVTAIMGFMVRYLDVVGGEFGRQHVAMQSRGYSPRWIGDLGPHARSIGRLFVRSYERGERVYLAMAARGYVGSIPRMARAAATPAAWGAAMAVPAAAWTLAVVALVVR
ncbi:MAG TPA: cobalt ECF transporter T component CbiQ [Acidimicrobiia bacterium]